MATTKINKKNKEYLNLTNEIWDDFRFKVEYLFYSNLLTITTQTISGKN
jgi:hypothetical protein